MNTSGNTKIAVQAIIDAPLSTVWNVWNEPEHIRNWAYATEDWHAPYAENDLREGGKFKTTMAAKDGSFSFDFGGTYTTLQDNELIEYTMDDGRTVSISFRALDGGTEVVEIFEAEDDNPEEMQRDGWQAILNNFKRYAESVK